MSLFGGNVPSSACCMVQANVPSLADRAHDLMDGVPAGTSSTIQAPGGALFVLLVAPVEQFGGYER
jgi:hypothetical protein